MKSEIKENKIKRAFPKLMKYVENNGDSIKSYIILAFNDSTGIVVYSNNSSMYVAGYYSTSFNTDCFEDFEGELTLSND